MSTSGTEQLMKGAEGGDKLEVGRGMQQGSLVSHTKRGGDGEVARTQT